MSMYPEPDPGQQGGGLPPSTCSSQTVLQTDPTGDDLPASGTMQVWGIITLVLGVVVFGMSVMRLFSLSAASGFGLTVPGKALVTPIALITLWVSIAMIVGSIGAMVRREWGRLTVVIGAVAAMLLVVVDILYTFTTIAVSPSPYEQGSHLWALAVDPVELVYLGFLLWFMASTPARAATYRPRSAYRNM